MVGVEVEVHEGSMEVYVHSKVAGGTHGDANDDVVAAFCHIGSFRLCELRSRLGSHAS